MIKSKSEILVFDNILVERVEKDSTVIWYGEDTNWKFENGEWFVLRECKFVPSDVPEYEIQYQELVSEKGDETSNCTNISPDSFLVNIHIGEIYDLALGKSRPREILTVRQDAADVLLKFANVRKDSNLNEIYIVNDCEFTVYSKLSFNDE